MELGGTEVVIEAGSGAGGRGERSDPGTTAPEEPAASPAPAPAAPGWLRGAPAIPGPGLAVASPEPGPGTT
jgi:hypothetical protein